MSHIRIDKQKAVKKWSPVLENMGVTGDRVEWMAEYAEFHSINENAYANATTAGMGAVLSPNPSSTPGFLGYTTTTANAAGNIGSGDLGQNLLPVAMKIAAQTIGLDLVAVKPTPGPKIDLLYIDFQYDDVNTESGNQRPQVFKITSGTTGYTAAVAALTSYVAGQSAITQTTGGLRGGRVFLTVATGAAGSYTSTTGTFSVAENTPSANRGGWVEFLGFSRIDGSPMLKTYRQVNAYGAGGYSSLSTYSFEQQLNTFNATASMTAQITTLGTAAISSVAIDLVSALEDHLPGFSANWAASSASGDYPMSRQTDDNTYAGVIGPKVSSKSVAVGTIEVSTALRRSEIEDIKANTGMDIVQKMESILVNELSQTISRQIVDRLFALGTTNRNNSPVNTTLSGGGSVLATASTIFDLNTAYAGSSVTGETTHAVQRKLITKMVHASNYIATEGRVGPAQFAVTNGGLAAALMDIAGYTINPVKSKISGQGQLYPVGQIGDISIYVDPYMKYNDNRILLGRKNNPDQPGLIFIPYLMAQSISVISEATFAPRMLLRSRYAVADVGFFPEKQYMTIVVTDNNQLLN
jgi:hypothetical protein